MNQSPRHRLFWSLAPFILIIGSAILLMRFNLTRLTVSNVPAAEVESLITERVLLEPGSISIAIINNGRTEITIAQATINNAAWLSLILPNPTIQAGEQATVFLNDYEWVAGTPYEISLLTRRGNRFTITIPKAKSTLLPSTTTLLPVTLTAIIIGLLPVYLGMLWLPAISSWGATGAKFIVALAIGALSFNSVSIFNTHITSVERIPRSFQGLMLVFAVGATIYLILTWLKNQQTISATQASQGRLSLANYIAFGLGLFGLMEGVNIGAIMETAKIDMATLIIGTILLGLPKGLAIIAPLYTARPNLIQLIMMGFVAGFSVVLGSWLGAFSATPTIILLILGASLGAITVVITALIRFVRADLELISEPNIAILGAICGLVLMWSINYLIF